MNSYWRLNLYSINMWIILAFPPCLSVIPTPTLINLIPPAIHLLNYLIQVYVYSGFRIANPYLHGNQVSQLEYSASTVPFVFSLVLQTTLISCLIFQLLSDTRLLKSPTVMVNFSFSPSVVIVSSHLIVMRIPIYVCYVCLENWPLYYIMPFFISDNFPYSKLCLVWNHSSFDLCFHDKSFSSLLRPMSLSHYMKMDLL